MISTPRTTCDSHQTQEQPLSLSTTMNHKTQPQCQCRCRHWHPLQSVAANHCEPSILTIVGTVTNQQCYNNLTAATRTTIINPRATTITTISPTSKTDCKPPHHTTTSALNKIKCEPRRTTWEQTPEHHHWAVIGRCNPMPWSTARIQMHGPSPFFFLSENSTWPLPLIPFRFYDFWFVWSSCVFSFAEPFLVCLSWAKVYFVFLFPFPF